LHRVAAVVLSSSSALSTGHSCDNIGFLAFDFPLAQSFPPFALCELKEREQRVARRIGYEALSARKRLDVAPYYLSLRQAAHVLGCDKTTAKKYLVIGALRQRHARRKCGVRERTCIPWTSVRDFIALCEKCRSAFGRRKSFETQRIGEQRREAVRRLNFRALPTDLTITHVAKILGCSLSTVLRMIPKGELRAHLVSPSRWRISRAALRVFAASRNSATDTA
jgi:excisionase family DNA binding protein